MAILFLSHFVGEEIDTWEKLSTLPNITQASWVWIYYGPGGDLTLVQFELCFNIATHLLWCCFFCCESSILQIPNPKL